MVTALLQSSLSTVQAQGTLTHKFIKVVQSHSGVFMDKKQRHAHSLKPRFSSSVVGRVTELT